MKKLFNFIGLAMIIFISGCAGSSNYMAPATPISGPEQDKAVVYFMRPSGMGFAINFQIWDRDQFIGLSQAKSYFAYQCDPGKHLFIGIAENKRGVLAELEAGKSYYMITQVRMGGWRARLAMIPVTRDSKFWDQVETYKSKLKFIQAKPEMIAQWNTTKKAKIQEIINILENTEKGKKYVLPLTAQDGR